MNQRYWKAWYKKKHELEPSDFAKSCVKEFRPYSHIIDLGCGNGRDSYFFADKGHAVMGVDFAVSPKPSFTNGYTSFTNQNLSDLFKTKCLYDVVYSRFFLHAISKRDLINLLKWSKGLFIAEFRCVGDKPVLYTKHKRNLIDLDELVYDMKNLYYGIISEGQGRGLAKYKNEDPFVGRIMAIR